MLKSHSKNKRTRISQTIMKNIQKLFKSINSKEYLKPKRKKEYEGSTMQICLDQYSYAAVVIEDFLKMELQK